MKAYLKYIGAMLIFGTVGIFVRYLPFSSPVIALERGVIGLTFLLLLLFLRREKLSEDAIRSNAGLLILSGAFLGLNWVALFESYRYTTVARATLCYYLAPVIVILLSPVLLKEKLTLRRVICAGLALVGMVFVSGVTESSAVGENELRGILFGLTAAVFYALVVLCNKKMKSIGASDKTIVQLVASSAVLTVYLCVTGGFPMVGHPVSGRAIALLLTVGIVHTGIAYALYFSSLSAGGVSSQTAAVLSYLDPVTAILLSALFLNEPMTPLSIVGTVLVLGSALIGELPAPKKKGKENAS